MKIVCISDTHMQHDFKVPKGDMIIHAGDATWRGTQEEVGVFAKWYGGLPHKHKIFVAGNHDWGFQKDPGVFRAMMQNAGIIYLEDSGVNIEGLSIWGSPWQPEFCNWAFNLPRGAALAAKWALIPGNTDVLITHGPPYGILDSTDQGEHVGCGALAVCVSMFSPRLHVFGHIHHSHGSFYFPESPEMQFVNASVCNEEYKPVNAPIVVEL